jgi:hypothetical protein
LVRFEKLNIGNAPRLALQRSGTILKSLARAGVIIKMIGGQREGLALRCGRACPPLVRPVGCGGHAPSVAEALPSEAEALSSAGKWSLGHGKD